MAIDSEEGELGADLDSISKFCEMTLKFFKRKMKTKHSIQCKAP